MKTRINLKNIVALLLAVLLAFPFSAVAEEVGFSLPVGDGLVENEPETNGESIIADEQEEGGELVELPTETEPFDVPAALINNGSTYMSGVGNGNFSPDKQMTRAEFATVIYNLLKNKPTPKADTFTDIKSGWYVEAVNSVAAGGYMGGYTDGSFRPSNSVTRAEVVATFSRFFSQQEAAIPFKDVPSSQWFYKAVITGYALGWIDSADYFRPNDPIKRSEVVKITNRVLERKIDKGENVKQKFKDVPKTHWAFFEINEAADNPDGFDPPEDPPGDPPGEDPPSTNLLIVTGDGVRLRSGPGTTYSIIETMSKGTILTALDKSNDEWYKVKTSGGREGYASAEFLETYTGGTSGTGEISASSANVPQYKTIFLYAQVNGSPTNARWKSSNEAIASVKPVSGRGFVYAKAQGKATISLLDATDKVIDTCEITVTKPEAVRFTYAEPNTPTKGQDFYIYAITDTSRSEVRFDLSGAASGSQVCKTSTIETRENAGYDTNTVRVFKQKLRIDVAGDYVIKAYSKDSSGWSTGYAQFNMLVKNSGSLSATTTEERSVSAEMVEVIGSWEGARNLVYIDELSSSKVPTVGYGYTLDENETFYNSLTQSELRAMLQDTLNNDGYVKGVKDFQKKNGIKMNQYQFDALVSFVYNLGPGVLTTSYNTFKVMMNATSKTSGSGKLNIKNLPMYANAAATGSPLTTVPDGTSVTVQEIKRIDGEADNLWYKISYGGKTGWIRGGGVNMGTSSPDLQYIDEQMFGSNMLEWISAGGKKLAGLLYRRLAEAKVFCYGGYDDAKNTSANKDNRHNFGLDIPPGVPDADIIED